MPPTEITKAQLLELMETDHGLEYFGRIEIATEIRLYYRKRMLVSPEPFKIVYIVE